MAPPPQGKMRPGRYLLALGVIFAALGIWVFAGGSGGWQERLQPKLGLDLVGGTRVTYTAVTSDGSPPSPQDLEQARLIMVQRVDGKGVSEAEVITEGDRSIVISLAGKGAEESLREIGDASQMLFRKVLNQGQGFAVSSLTPEPTASPSTDPSASPNPSASPSVDASSSPSPSPEASGSGGGAAVATPTPSPSASVKPKPTTLDAVKAKVGQEAWDTAAALTAPLADEAQFKKLEPFYTLNEQEVKVLPANIQFYVPQIGCEVLDKRPVGSISKADEQVVACDASNKYLLDVAKVKGSDVSSATAQIDQQSQRVVALEFSGEGADKWRALTKEAVTNEGGGCDASTLEGTKCRVAVVLDNEVISAPTIQEVMSTQSQITGNFTGEEAKDLANKINYGALEVTFELENSENVTATLGKEHLRAGLLAAGIGMLLVIIYSFFYYRLLGTVIFLSLVLSGLLVFGALIVLGRQIGFTLTLAGIAGFIVSLGVAADSFVIYFERLKDEIREGRTPRSAVPRAWARARKTILTANAISLMAALVLYIVSAGAVRGFAFALGVATALDLVVVFLFRHPIMALFARTGAFLSPRVSGLGRVLNEGKEANS